MEAKIEIVPIVYFPTDITTDFSWMVQQSQYAATLFIYNDNEINFNNFLKTPVSELISGRAKYRQGGGNAKAIRPYQYMYPIRAMGIPLGKIPGNGNGYKSLGEKEKKIINKSLELVKDLLSTGLYDTIVYSAGPDGRKIGSSIFTLPEEIIDYVTEKIWSLGS